MGTRGPVRLGASRQIRMGCTIWEATCGSGVRIGTIRRTASACCAVRRGTITTRIVCSPLFAAPTIPIVVALTPDFVAFWLGSLRSKAETKYDMLLRTTSEPQQPRRQRERDLALFEVTD